MRSPPTETPLQPISSPTSIVKIKALLRQIVRITVLDGRIFLGTFVGMDQPLNIILINTEEFRQGCGGSPVGRYVGQVMIPWRLVTKAEVKKDSDATHSDIDDN